MERNERDRIFEVEMIGHYQVVFNYLLRLTGNETEACDLVQDTFDRAFRKLETYTVGTNARAWLFTIAHNLFVNAWRKKNRRNETEMDERIAFQRADESNPMVAFEDLRREGLLDQGLSDDVVRALEQLNEAQRSVILMADYYDYTEKEISKITGENLNTVKSRTHRARLKLIRLLDQYAASTYGVTTSRNLG